MDEPTTLVDLETDYLIQRKLRELTKDKTIIVVAQRITTIIDADNIFIMNKGKIVEEGNPYEMLVNDVKDSTITKKGKFANLMMQLGPQAAKALFKIAKHKYFGTVEA